MQRRRSRGALDRKRLVTTSLNSAETTDSFLRTYIVLSDPSTRPSSERASLTRSLLVGSPSWGFFSRAHTLTLCYDARRTAHPARVPARSHPPTTTTAPVARRSSFNPHRAHPNPLARLAGRHSPGMDTRAGPGGLRLALDGTHLPRCESRFSQRGSQHLQLPASAAASTLALTLALNARSTTRAHAHRPRSTA